MATGYAAYCKPRGSALSEPVKTCRPGSAPKGCFFRIAFETAVIVVGTPEVVDIAPVQNGVPVDLVDQNSGAGVFLDEIQFPFMQGDDNWLPKFNANQSTANVAQRYFMGSDFAPEGLDYGTHPWPQGLPICNADNFLRMLFDGTVVGEIAQGYVIFWNPPNASPYLAQMNALMSGG